MHKKYTTLLALCLGLLLGQPAFSQAPKATTPDNLIAQEPCDEETDANSTTKTEDGMLAAMKQEVAQTMDPALGYVPRQRLYNALQKLDNNTRTGGLAAGIHWTERGPSNKGGRTRAIMVDPNDHTHKSVFGAGVDGGLWKTTQINNADPAWKIVNDKFSNLAIVTIAYDSAHPKIMYFGTGEGWYNNDAIQGDGIFKSTDGGSTWTQLTGTTSNTDFNFIQKIVVDPKTSYVYAGTRTGLFRSKDGGSTWHNVLSSASGSLSDAVCDIAIGADDSIYVAMGLVFYGVADGIYKSYSGDSGKWVKKNTLLSGFPTAGFQRVALACAPSNAKVIYAMAQDLSTNGIYGIYKSTNGGNTWTSLTLPNDDDPYITTDITRKQAWYDLTLAVNPLNDSLILVGGVDLFRSTNGGRTWAQLTHWQGAYGHQYMHSDQHAIVYVPKQGDTLYFGNDGGIYQSTDRGTTIQSKDSNYRVIQFYACALNPGAGSNQMLAGAQDNGTFRFSQSALNAGNNVVQGDGMFCHIDQSDPTYQVAAGPYSTYYASTDSGQTFTLMIRDIGQFDNPTDFSSLDGILYGGYNYGSYLYWVDPHTGSSYYSNSIPALTSSYIVSAVTASPTQHYRVYMGSNNGRVFLMDSAIASTPTITDITGSLMPFGTIKCIAIDPGNDKHLLVTYGNYGINSVWETTDNGGSWTSVEGNLPDMPVRWALFDPNHSSKALLATELGVWVTDSLNGSSTSWSAANNGLANVEVDMLKWRGSDNTVIAATHGRGLFSTPYFTNAPCAFTRNTINDTIVSGNSVTINKKKYKTAGTFSDTLRRKTTHCDSVILTINITVSSGINTISAPATLFTINPNPAHAGQYMLNLVTTNHSPKAYISTVNILGQVVDQTEAPNVNGHIQAHFNNTSLANGIYLVKVHVGSAVYTTRLVIEN